MRTRLAATLIVMVGCSKEPALLEAVAADIAQTKSDLADPKSPATRLERLVNASDAERARLEDMLRRDGDDTIHALADFFPTIPHRLEGARPGWMQTRLLTHVVDQIDTEDAAEFAYSVFEDSQYNSGVRLKAAASAMARQRERVILGLIGLLENSDPTFSNPEQIVQFFKANPEPRAIPAICSIASNVEAERTARRFALEVLGGYDDPMALDTLEEVATFQVHGDLRGVAMVSLNRRLGREIVPFVEQLRNQWERDDPMHQLLDNIDKAHERS